MSGGREEEGAGRKKVVLVGAGKDMRNLSTLEAKIV